MANGRKTPTGQPELRASAPHQGGPLGSSGAAPEAPKIPAAAKPDKSETSESETEVVPTPGAKAADKAPEASPAIGAAKTEEASAASGPDKTEVATASEAAGKTDVATASEGAGKTDVATAAEGAGKTDVATAAEGAEKTEVAPKAAGAGAEVKPAPPTPRRPHPVRAVARVGRSTSAWAKRPSGRLVVPGIIALLLLGAAGTAGAYLVPKALDAAPAPSATPEFGGGATAASAPSAGAPGGLPTGSAPVGASGAPAVTTPAAQGQFGQTGQRPADALAGWAQQIGTKVSIPVVALEAYGYAELVLAKTTPSCHLSWTTIAALGKVESDHGSANGAVLGADGEVQPPIYGLPMDGKGGRQLIRDTDQGTIDGDTTYDRAVGPLQFVPQTWSQYKVDADNNGVADPNDIDDASLTAATYLCQGGRDLSKAESWWDAVLSYNTVQPYAQKVFEAANDYGQRSRG